MTRAVGAGSRAPRPTSPRRSSRQHLERPSVQGLPIGRVILATVDTPGDLVELAGVGQGVEALG